MSMASAVWLVVAFLGVVFIVVSWKRGGVKKLDYKGLFYVGLIFTAVGVFEKVRYGDVGLLALGIIFLVVGLAKKKEWRKS